MKKRLKHAFGDEQKLATEQFSASTATTSEQKIPSTSHHQTPYQTVE